MKSVHPLSLPIPFKQLSVGTVIGLGQECGWGSPLMMYMAHKSCDNKTLLFLGHSPLAYLASLRFAHHGCPNMLFTKLKMWYGRGCALCTSPIGLILSPLILGNQSQSPLSLEVMQGIQISRVRGDVTPIDFQTNVWTRMISAPVCL